MAPKKRDQLNSNQPFNSSATFLTDCSYQIVVNIEITRIGQVGIESSGMFKKQQITNIKFIINSKKRYDSMKLFFTSDVAAKAIKKSTKSLNKAQEDAQTRKIIKSLRDDVDI